MARDTLEQNIKIATNHFRLQHRAPRTFAHSECPGL